MGFTRDRGQHIVAGMFGRELFDLIYPQWWGGQGLASQLSPTDKVNNKAYEPGSNFAALMQHPLSATRHYDEENLQSEVAKQGSVQNTEDLHMARRPVTSALLRKERIDPVSMKVAGVATAGYDYRNVVRNFDPYTYYGLEGTINGGGEPVYPIFKRHEFNPPAHIPQVRDPTLRSLYPKPAKKS